MKKTALFILVICSLTSCKKLLGDLIEKKVNNILGEMTFTVDKKTFKDITAASLDYKGKLKTEAIVDLGLKAKTLSLRIDEEVVKDKSYTSASAGVEVAWKDLTQKDGNYSSAITGGDCFIKITEKTSKSIIGTFSGKLVNETDKTKFVTITDGNFNVKILVD